jgi:hypothetical protein
MISAFSVIIHGCRRRVTDLVAKIRSSALLGSDRSTLKFRQLYVVWNEAARSALPKTALCHNPRLTRPESGSKKMLFESCQRDTPKVLSFTGGQHAVGKQPCN